MELLPTTWVITQLAEQDAIGNMVGCVLTKTDSNWARLQWLTISLVDSYGSVIEVSKLWRSWCYKEEKSYKWSESNVLLGGPLYRPFIWGKWDNNCSFYLTCCFLIWQAFMYYGKLHSNAFVAYIPNPIKCGIFIAIHMFQWYENFAAKLVNK